MELRHFRYFLTVAEELHFGRAAERLHIAQPALSIQIRNLETMLGGPLFRRTNKSVRLTEAGRLFVNEARQTLERAAQARRVVEQALSGEIAAIDIGFSASAIYSGIFGKALTKVRSQCPGIEIKVHELSPQTQLESILNRSIQLAFMPTLALDIPNKLRIDRMAEWPLQVAMPKSHPNASLAVISLESLISEQFITYVTSEADDGLPFLSALEGFVPNVTQRVSSASMIVELVAAGLGIALLPSSLDQPQFRNDVVFKTLEVDEIIVDCSLISWEDEFEPSVELVRSAVLASREDQTF